MRISTRIAAAVVGTVVLTWSGMAAAQDHLACLKMKDSLPKATYTIGQISAYGAFGQTCQLKTGAKEVCYAAFKLGVTPPPPGGGPSTPLQGLSQYTFFCYKVKCQINFASPLPATDQFGTHAPIVKPKIMKLCAPASPSGAFIDDTGSE